MQRRILVSLHMQTGRPTVNTGKQVASSLSPSVACMAYSVGQRDIQRCDSVVHIASYTSATSALYKIVVGLL